MAVKNLLIRGGADFSGVKKELDKAQKNISSFQSGVSSAMSKVKLALATIGMGAIVKESTQTAMSVESSLNNINRNMQNSAKVFGDWVKSQSQGFGISTQEAYQYGSTFSNLISSFAKSTAEVQGNTQGLMKATAIIASSTGRTFEDTAERIRSGMVGSTEAIEDLGIYTNISMIESTNAFKQFANDKSWAQLDFQTQQQIRLAAILEQSYDRYGDTLADTTQVKHSQFIASLKNVQLALGQAFMPIYNAILPPLTLLMGYISKAISVFAQFTTALFGKPKEAKKQAQAISSQGSAVADLSDSLDNTATSAENAKKALGSVASFDEINSLSQSSDSSGSGTSGATGGASTPSFEGLDLGGDGLLSTTLEVSESVQKMADKIKTILGNLKKFIIENKAVITSVIGGLVASIGSFLIISNWAKIIGVVKAAITGLGAVLGGLSLPIVAVAALIGLIVGNLIYLWQTNEGFRDSVMEVWNKLKEFFMQIVSDIGTILTDLWSKYGQTLIDNLSAVMTSIQNIIQSVWEGVIKPIIENALKVFKDLWDNHLKDLVMQLGEFIMKLVNGAMEIWSKFIAPIIGFLIDTFGPAFSKCFNTVITVVGYAIGILADIIKGIIRILGGIIDFVVGVFTGNWSKAWGGIKDIFGGIWDTISAIPKGAFNVVIRVINWAIGKINDALTIDIPDWDILPNAIQGKSYSLTIPQIPYLAKGGVVDSPTMAMIGEAGKEAVVPLENNTQGLDLLANKLLERMPQGNSDNTNSGDLTLIIDGSVIGKVALNQLRKMQRQGNITLIPT